MPRRQGTSERRAGQTIANLAFARQTFRNDASHRVYYLEATRLEAIAYACVGRDAAARKLFEELQDATYHASSARERQLSVEAEYNQAMLHWRQSRTPDADGTAALMASSLFEHVAATGDDALAAAVRVWQLADLADLTRREWLAMDRTNAHRQLLAAEHVVETVDAAAKRAVSTSDRRPYALLAGHARRCFATAQLRFIAAFELPSRGPFANGHRDLPDSLRGMVRTSLDAINGTAQLGPLPSDVASARAYGLLLLARWLDAEDAAVKAFAANKSDQFALYVAAEAALQRQAMATARQYLKNLTPATSTDPALSDLVAALMPAA